MPMFRRNLFFASVFALLCSLQSTAYGYDALIACRAGASLPSKINDCMDNYLDLLDQNLGELTIFIDSELRGRERAAFNRAQNSFYSYRRENCLWYLALGDEGPESEQVAKNCLAEMSQNRLAELQGLIASYGVPEVGPVVPEANALQVEPVPATTQGNQTLVTRADPLSNSATDTSDSATADETADEGISAFLGQWQVICLSLIHI